MAKCHLDASICSLSLLTNSVYKDMAKEEAIEVMAKVLEILPNAMFRVEWKTANTRFWRIFLGKCVNTSSAFFLAIGCWLSFRPTT